MKVPEHYTPEEIAEILKIQPHVLTQWAYRGKGPRFIKVGKARRYPKPWFEEWYAELAKAA